MGVAGGAGHQCSPLTDPAESACEMGVQSSHYLQILHPELMNMEEYLPETSSTIVMNQDSNLVELEKRCKVGFNNGYSRIFHSPQSFLDAWNC